MNNNIQDAIKGADEMMYTYKKINKEKRALN